VEVTEHANSVPLSTLTLVNQKMNSRTIFAQIITLLLALILFLVLQAGFRILFNAVLHVTAAWPIDTVALALTLLLYAVLNNFISQNLHRVIHRKEIFLETQLAQLKDEVSFITHLLRLQRVVVRRITELMRIPTASLFLLDESTQIYELSDGLGVTQKDKLKIQFKSSGGLLVWLKMDKKPLYFPKLQKDKRFLFLGKEEKDKIRRLQTDLCLPLLLGDQIVGLLFLGPKATKKPYTLHEIEMLQDVANQAAQAIMNATAQRDLTSLEREAIRNQNRIRNLENRLTEVQKVHQNLLDYFKSGIAVLKIKDQIIQVNQAVNDEMLPELENRFQQYITNAVLKSK
jgi:transcriptional regulator with GAF, ATPase, and Fis domain